MKKVCWLLGIILVVFVSVALASDVAEVAKKEKERREKTKDPGKTFTNQDVDEFKKKNKIEDEESVEGEEGEEAATEEKAGASIPSDQDPSSVDYWSKKAGEVQAKVDKAQEKVDKIQADIDQLQLALGAYGAGQNYGAGNTTSNTDVLAARFEDRTAAQNELDTARAELESIQEDARQSGIPAGYVTAPEKEEPEPETPEE